MICTSLCCLSGPQGRYDFSVMCCVLLTIMSKVTQDSTEASIETAATSQPSPREFLVDNPSLRITTVKLDGKNYLNWFRSAIFFN